MLFENYLYPLLDDVYYRNTYSGSKSPTPPVTYQYYLLDNSGENLLVGDTIGNPYYIFVDSQQAPIVNYRLMDNSAESILVDDNENVWVN